MLDVVVPSVESVECSRCTHHDMTPVLYINWTFFWWSGVCGVCLGVFVFCGGGGRLCLCLLEGEWDCKHDDGGKCNSLVGGLKVTACQGKKYVCVGVFI